MTLTAGMILIAAGAALFVVADVIVRRGLLRAAEQRARGRSEQMLSDASKQAETRLKEAEIASRERADALEAASAEREQARRAELADAEARLREQKREAEKALNQVRQQRSEADRREAQMVRRGADLDGREADIGRRLEEAERRLQEIAGLTQEQARARLVQEMTAEARREAGEQVRRITEEARETAEERVREVTGRALQRLTTGGFAESTMAFIRLPNDEMKGRIIGREGRNIRSLEMTTGIDLIVDDTPGTILISCFEPLRREVARISIERLLEDGRIHPARIEEIVEKTKLEVEQMVMDSGEAALYELGLQDVHPRLVRLLGRLRHHTHLGHNLLQHCRETADLAGVIAVELGLSPDVARRAGLLHEIAQASEERPSAPVLLASAEMAGRHGESDAVQHAIAAVHPDVAPRTIDAAAVRFACRLSRARPGARRQNLEVFIARLRRLEDVARSFPGVTAAYAFRAGKELRVLIDASKLTDEDAVLLSRDIAARIKREADHAGEVRVSVLRETRVVDYAL